ncbi:hypothetical protein TNCT_248761 [Trichonephila clavata]|uniref:Uncharacterized protein n=1 Tax=Trichonephila clavata TaxID=2740835 RepID=A0A8X6FAA1_TRICU|nr:hypothetical protein TNCT_248761 [Trichonephila clavata]
MILIVETFNMSLICTVKTILLRLRCSEVPHVMDIGHTCTGDLNFLNSLYFPNGGRGQSGIVILLPWPLANCPTDSTPSPAGAPPIFPPYFFNFQYSQSH